MKVKHKEFVDNNDSLCNDPKNLPMLWNFLHPVSFLFSSTRYPGAFRNSVWEVANVV